MSNLGEGNFSDKALPNYNCSGYTPPSPCSFEVEYIINVYIYTTVAVLGILTNVVNILVLFHSEARLKRTNFPAAESPSGG